MSNARIAIGRLQALRGQLLSPLDFYARHLAPYRALAREVAIQVLTNLRPPEADPEVWAHQSAELASFVQASLTLETIGMVISLADPKAALPADSPSNFASGGLAIADIERFVEAGRDKQDRDAPGKNLDSRDDGKSDLQIAWRIMYALRLRTSAGAPRLEEAIRRFLAAEQRTEAEKLLPQVLAAWVQFIAPRAQADWRKWVSETVALNT